MSAAGDRLARSRLAIIEQVHSRDKGAVRREEARRERARQRAAGEPETALEAFEQRGEGISGWLEGVKHAAGTWWRHHPAHMGVELVTPLLSTYARKHPVPFLGIAAALGAVTVVVRPWRVITVGGLLAALLKSSQVSGLLISALSAANFQKDHRRPYE